jgi:hypothetical protein
VVTFLIAKYQQICAEHSSQNGDSESGSGVQGAISSTSSSKSDSNNLLSGLVGPYHSDSEAEEEGREAAGNLDAKVSDFLKVSSSAVSKFAIYSVQQISLFVHYIMIET